ncbi:MAG: hypothetical protein AB7H90_24105 [Alphaproteobacteria bacterium]
MFRRLRSIHSDTGPFITGVAVDAESGYGARGVGEPAECTRGFRGFYLAVDRRVRARHALGMYANDGKQIAGLYERNGEAGFRPRR